MICSATCLIAAVFIWWILSPVPKNPPFFVFDPSECANFGKTATGWEIQHHYKGGINRGGISSAIEYECK